MLLVGGVMERRGCYDAGDERKEILPVVVWRRW